MRAAQRDKLVADLDHLAQWAGAVDFEAAAQRLKEICLSFLEKIEPIQTKEDFKKLLDGMPDPSFTEELMLRGILRTFPQLLRYGIKQLAKIADEKLPAPPTGRPPIDYQTRAEIITFIGSLHIRGTGLEIAKKRAAQLIAGLRLSSAFGLSAAK